MWDASFWHMSEGWAWMPLMGLIPLLFLALLVAIVVLLVRWMSNAPERPPGSRGSSALDALGERYARGEISREEYLQKKADLVG
jgi:putative membrane protein